jgi:hypothetical protein
MVEKSSIASLLSMILNPCGPIITPEIIKPITPGIFSLRSTKGDRRIMKRITEKKSTGLEIGSSNS